MRSRLACKLLTAGLWVVASVRDDADVQRGHGCLLVSVSKTEGEEVSASYEHMRQFVRGLCMASLLACLDTSLSANAQSSPSFQRHSFSLVHLTENEVAHLNFTLEPSSGPVQGDTVGSVQVQLNFLDSRGNAVFEPESQSVVPGQSISLDLYAEDLGSSGSGFRAVVDTLSPNARFVATLEVEDIGAAARFVLFRAPWFGAQVWPPPPIRHCLGPLTLKSDETATVTYTNIHPACQNCNESTKKMTLEFLIGTTVLAEKFVTVESHQSASLDLSNFSGPVRACIRPTERSWVIVGAWSFEIFRNDTGQRVGLLSDHWPSESGGNGGGGAGGGP